ncbi:DUF222 domain-containing protein [Georgenia yuyongxinii]
MASVDRSVSDAERIDQLRVLEELKAAASAAQARIAVDLEASQLQVQASAGVPRARRGRGIGAQVALARRESHARGGRLLGLAKALVNEMPHTFAALEAGVISEWRATLLVRESACLTVVDRAAFDVELWADPGATERLGDRRLVARAKQIAYRLDPRSVVRRAAKAESERCVTLRPAPDTMTYLTGLLPVVQGVGVYAALTRAADALRAQGDPRSRGQIMADTLVERVTGQDRAADVPVEVQVVMTDRALLAGNDEPAVIPGYGTVPAGWARALIAARTGTADAVESLDGAGRKVLVWLRRLFTAPSTGQLVAMDSRRRTVPPGLARFIDARDQVCRTLWCDAPIRHHDHIQAHADSGTTSAENLRGTCEACNYAKQAPGWGTRTVTVTGAEQRAGPGPSGHVVETTTPTGHRYTSDAPPLPGHVTPTRATAPPGTQAAYSPAERLLLDLNWAA